MISDRQQAVARPQPQVPVKAYYSPTLGITEYRCGYWSRDGLFYPTGRARKTREEAEADHRRRIAPARVSSVGEEE